MNSTKRLSKYRGLKAREPQIKIRQEIHENLRLFGTQFLKGSIQGRRKAQLLYELQKMLYEELSDQLVEFRIRPEDPQGHHWTISYSILITDENGRLIRAFDKRRSD